jgi:hypothetical protein
MKYTILALLAFPLFMGCKKQQIPAYIKINHFDMVQNPSVPNSTEGELTQNITNVLVYVNGNNLGYYELPITIPVLAEGGTDIKLYPAVEQNGIGGTIIDYPFYKPFDTTLNLIPEADYELFPTTMYHDNVVTWIMDFEGANSLNSEPNSVVDMVKITDPMHVQYGSGCGHVHLVGSDSLWNARTNSYAGASGKVWVEMDYKTTNSILNTFIAGFSAGQDEYPYLFITPQASGSEYWKKIYIDFTENVTAINSANYYEAGFTAILDENLTSSDVYLDNIKIIYFQ